MPRLSPLCIAWACAALALPHTIAFAAPQVWRCANNSYSDSPCEGGRAIGAGAAPPSSEQRRQADEGTRNDQAAAERMQRERQHLEAQQGSHRTLVIGPAPRETSRAAASSPTVLKPPKTKKAEKPDAFIASGADPQATKKKKAPKKPPADGAG